MKMQSFEELEQIISNFVDQNQNNIEYYQKGDTNCVPDLSRYEKFCIKRITVIYRQLRKYKIHFEYEPEYQMFKIHKFRWHMSKPTMVWRNKKGRITRTNSEKVMDEYPTYQWVGFYDDGSYCFGGEEEDFTVSTKIKDVVEDVLEWLGNNEPGAK